MALGMRFPNRHGPRRRSAVPGRRPQIAVIPTPRAVSEAFRRVPEGLPLEPRKRTAPARRPPTKDRFVVRAARWSAAYWLGICSSLVTPASVIGSSFSSVDVVPSRVSTTTLGSESIS